MLSNDFNNNPLPNLRTQNFISNDDIRIFCNNYIIDNTLYAKRSIIRGYLFVLIFDRFDIGNRISNRHLIDAA